MMRGETLLIFGHGVIGQGQFAPLPPARGCHALRCLVVLSERDTCAKYQSHSF